MTARAKGLPEGVVVWRHGFKNALILVITVVGLEFGALISGSIIVETIFAWAGHRQPAAVGPDRARLPAESPGLVLVYTTASSSP